MTFAVRGLSNMSMCPSVMQDAKWAATSSKSGPVGQRCLACATAVARACPFEQWDDVLARCSVGQDYKDEIMMAVKIFKHEAERPWPAEGLTKHAESGYSVETPMIFFSEAAFLEKFGHRPSEAGLSLEQVQLEQNSKPTTGVLLREAPSKDGIRIRVFNSFVGDIHTELCNGAEALRPGLALQTLSRYEQGVTGKAGKAVLKAAQAAPLVSDLPRLRATWQESEKRQKEEEEQRRKLLEPAAVEDEEVRAEDAKDSEEEIVDHVQPKAVIPDDGKKRRRKDQGVSATTKLAKDVKPLEMAKTFPLALKASTARPPATLPSGSTAAASACGDQCSRASDYSVKTKKSGQPKESPGEKYSRKAREWLDELNITSGLEGTLKESPKKLAWQATETLKALERHRGTCPESVLLQSHIKAAEEIEASLHSVHDVVI